MKCDCVCVVTQRQRGGGSGGGRASGGGGGGAARARLLELEQDAGRSTPGGRRPRVRTTRNSTRALRHMSLKPIHSLLLRFKYDNSEYQKLFFKIMRVSQAARGMRMSSFRIHDEFNTLSHCFGSIMVNIVARKNSLVIKLVACGILLTQIKSGNLHSENSSCLYLFMLNVCYFFI